MKKKYFLIIISMSLVISGVVFLGLEKYRKPAKIISILNDLAVDDQKPLENQQSVVGVEKQKNDASSVVEDQPAVGEIPKNKTNSGEGSSTQAKINDEKANLENESARNVGKIVSRSVSWGFQKSADRKIDTVIVHSSYDAIGSDPYSVSGIIDEYKQAQVSAHYLIARDGTVYQLVADQNIAWHAGVAKMPDGRTDVNSFSIGIEMVNTKEGKFTSDQYDALNDLIENLKKKYPIKNILGHSDVAPGRKTDPWNIEWGKVKK